MEEIDRVADKAPVDEYGQSWIGMLRDEMRHFECRYASDLPWQSVVTHGMTLGCFDSEAEALEYVRSMHSPERDPLA